MPPLHDPAFWRVAILGFVGLVLSISVHEFGHAIVADRLGDPTPRRQGRVTLNPIVHADPVGTLALPIAGLVLTGGIGFGWGRPVQITPSLVRAGLKPRTAHLLIAAAGPVMNLLFGTLLCGLYAFVARRTVGATGREAELILSLRNAAALNYVLAFFNLLPVPPLDGSSVLDGLLPPGRARFRKSLARWGLFILAAVMFTPLRMVFLWPAQQTFRGMSGLFGAA
jgi:Zn-dependent protease